MKLRIETMAKTINTAELDSKASRYVHININKLFKSPLHPNSHSCRETILRLVSEAKKHEKSAGQMVELRQTQDQLQTTLKSFEKERGDLFQRLAATQETLTAQEKEINSKERRFEP